MSDNLLIAAIDEALSYDHAALSLDAWGKVCFAGYQLDDDILVRIRRSTVECFLEGIEEKAQFEALHALRCQYGQGYLMAKPMPAFSIVGV